MSRSGIQITPEWSLTVPPLSTEEKRWVARLQRTLRACPKRLEIVTWGDSTLGIVDRDGARRSELCDGAAEADGVQLATVTGGPLVHGVSP